MRRWFMILFIYSVLGFILERIINLIAFGMWVDNSLLIGPYQPLYGIGIFLAVLFYKKILIPFLLSPPLTLGILLIVSILTTAFSEAVTGYGFEFIYGGRLWNYGLFFPCQSPYVCVIPTTLFGIGSFLTIIFVHPMVEVFIKKIPRLMIDSLIVIFIIDVLIFIAF
ncbi:MAG: putative ABC transporter permease [Candidatus Izimaplasma sp.]|nr:putative ABC transporter permease [Candidatus Izimaplasma bacterium]